MVQVQKISGSIFSLDVENKLKKKQLY
jgi:hypothetical protein